MKRSKSQLNAISYSYLREQERYVRFLRDVVSKYVDSDFSQRSMESLFERYKQNSLICKKVRFMLYFDISEFAYLEFNITDYDFNKLLDAMYKSWKKRGGKF